MHNITTDLDLPIKSNNVRYLNIKTAKYSAIKIIAKKDPIYSVLYPDTSSLSPSGKSNGARFVSAITVINHKIILILKGIINQ